jgi:UDP-N-acetylmuramoyl-L-alanyl-D-glutamate--2,6-diaminopimelate ligase
MTENILKIFKSIIPKPVFNFFQPIYHFFISLAGRIMYGRSGKSMFVIGVTGTKGKTTAIELINTILEEAGEKTALLSSVYRKVGEKREKKKSPNTMPGRLYIPKFLKEAEEAGCKYAILEVTSQGVVQFRHKFIDWNVGIFLNIHPEHIESHGSFEKYRKAKVRFFKSMKYSRSEKKYFLINSDDENAKYFEEGAQKTPEENREIISFSVDDVYKMVEDILEKGGAPDWLKASFNLENLAAAAALAKIRNIQYRVIEKAIAKFKGLPGRLDFVAKRPYLVVVDYAHTPDSLRALYQNLRENYGMAKDGRLICVLGSAGGGRDKWKRPEMGKIAASYGDIVVLTSEDPYDEDPVAIMNDIKKGIDESSEKPQKLLEEADRKKAIELAISKAKPGDVVAITGIGSQDWFYGSKGEKIPWNEPEIAKEIFEKYNK